MIRSSICSLVSFGVGLFQVWELDSGMKVAGARVFAGESVKGSELEDG